MPNSNHKFDITSNNTVFRKINNLYLGANSTNNNSYYYGTQRQHNMSSAMATLPTNSALLDKTSFFKFSDYSLNHSADNSSNNISNLTQNNKPLINSLSAGGAWVDKSDINMINFYKNLNNFSSLHNLNFQNYLSNFSKYYTINLLTDKQDFINSAKILDSRKKNSTNLNTNNLFFDEFFTNSRDNFYS
jgi:hypothetical protein